MITEWEFTAVEDYLASLEKSGVVEKECGTPIKVKVDWESRTISIIGPHSGKILKINEILKAYKKKP